MADLGEEELLDYEDDEVISEPAEAPKAEATKAKK